MSEAVRYAGLVGKYIQMERPATEKEIAANLTNTIGMECTVACVYDSGDECVTIVSDYGIAYTVMCAFEHLWTFHIWNSEREKLEFEAVNGV